MPRDPVGGGAAADNHFGTAGGSTLVGGLPGSIVAGGTVVYGGSADYNLYGKFMALGFRPARFKPPHQTLALAHRIGVKAP